MRHTPISVHRIAMKAAAYVVAHAPKRHRPERGQRHVLRLCSARPYVLAQQEQQLARTRKLRTRAKTAPPAIERARKLSDSRIQHGPVRDATPAGASERSQALDDGVCRVLNLPALFAPDSRDFLENFSKPWSSPPRRRRKIGAAIE